MAACTLFAGDGVDDVVLAAAPFVTVQIGASLWPDAELDRAEVVNRTVLPS